MCIYSRGLVSVLGVFAVVLSSSLKASPALFDSVVRIVATNPEKQSSKRGAGVAIENGYILSALHVVDGCQDIEVIMGDGDNSVAYDGELVAKDELIDVCLIKIRGDSGMLVKLPAVKFCDQFPIQAGTRVYAIGNPMGFTRTVTEGIVSASGKNKGNNYILTDALIKEGNSGGPLVDQQGQLLGVVTSTMETGTQTQPIKLDPTRPMGYVVSVQDLKDFIANQGKPSNGVLGINGNTVKTGLSSSQAEEGFQVTKVLRPCGLERMDIIMMIEDTQVSTFQDVVRIVRPRVHGDTLKAYVLRSGTFKEVTLKVFDK